MYDTDGFETVDVLTGSTHTYPSQTTITITHAGCGLLSRWSVLDERWDEDEVCVTSAGRERRSQHTHHEFFGMTDDADHVCEPGYLLFPARIAVGATWSTRCEADVARMTGVGEIVGSETRRVGGEAVDTVHVRVVAEASGASEGESRQDYWFRTSDGLLVEQTSSTETRSDSPVGVATFTERFTLRLTSLVPRT